MLLSLKYFLLCTGFFGHLMITHCQIPANWTIDEVNPGEDVIIQSDGALFTEGSKSCHIQLTDGFTPYLISDIFFVLPGVDYRFSIDVMDNDSAGQVKVYADFYDAYGFNVFGEPPVFSVDTNIWQTIAWKGTIPAQAVVGYILIKFYCQPELYTFTDPADIWLDNIQFLEGEGNNLVTNGGFEDWVVGTSDLNTIEHTFIIYPNPAKDFTNIKAPDEFKYITLTDLAGRPLFEIQSRNSQNQTISLTDLESGMYIITLTFLDNNQISRLLFRF